MSRYQPEPKILKFEDPSYIKLAAQIGSLDAAKAEAQHSHVVADVTDASTELATKSHSHTKSDISDFGSYAAESHTHSSTDITDLSTAISTDLQHFIRCYETADLDNVSMEDGESFLYFDLTTGELCRRSKSGDDVTTTKIGKLSAIEE